MISYAEAKRRAQAAKPNWNEEEYITKAVIYWADAEYEYDLEVENEGDSDADFTAWLFQKCNAKARAVPPRCGPPCFCPKPSILDWS